jgi:prepilin signal peptidase PulO-like enzyme (type II secretory pathway)
MILIYIFTFIFGLCIGSFINALVYRLNENLPIGKARSICPKCKKQLRWFDNIPLLSFIFLRGKCHFCHEKISWQYPLVELATGILFLAFPILLFPNNILLFGSFTFCLYYFYCLAITAVLVLVFVYDLKYSIIPDVVMLPAIAVALIAEILLLVSNFSLANLSTLLFSAIIGGGWFALQYFLSKGRWCGGGDIRLGILMGLILPWPHILTALALAYVLGALVSLPLLIFKKKKMKSEIPFGIFLVPATLVVIFWGNQIVHWYFNLL